MRLQELQLQNYRVHRDLTVPLDNSLVLIAGPNESGKSTLAEAIHRALFLKAKGAGELQKAMQSTSGGTPTVRLQFEAAGQTHWLTKTFSGQNGTATLQMEGKPALSGDAAETALAGLLGFAAPAGGRSAPGILRKRWAHLWVWQGLSSHSPIEEAAETQRELQLRLQERVSSETLISRTDAAVIDRIKEQVAVIFTNNRQPRQNSELKQAEMALAKAEETLRHREASWEVLRQASEEHRQASESIAELERELRESKATLHVLRQKREAAFRHEQTRRELAGRRDALDKQLKELRAAQNRIAQLQSALTAGPKEEEATWATLAEAEVQRNAARSALESARQARLQANEAAQRANLLAEALRAHVAWLELAKQEEALQQRETAARELRRAHAEADAKRKQYQAFSPEAIAQLRQQQRALEQAQARLDGHALRLELREADTAVSLNGKALGEGEAITLSEDGELRVGFTVIRIGPAGGKRFLSAREAAQQTREALSKRLRELGADDVETAEASAAALAKAEQQASDAKARLAELHVEAIPREREALQAERARLEARRAEAESLPNDPVFAQTHEVAVEAAKNAESKRVETRRAEQAANAEEARKIEAAEAAEKRLELQQKASESQRENERKLRAELAFYREQATETARAEQIKRLEHERAQAAAALAAEEKALAELNADALDAKVNDGEQGLGATETALQRERERRSEAAALLRQSGASNPERELREARGEVDQLRQRHRALQQGAEAKLYLLDAFYEARREMAAALTRPLEMAAQPYLQAIFGEQTLPHLRWDSVNGSLRDLRLERQQRGTFSFESLSHGTREQVALALRLAMAEVLAADHDGCLPIVLDDAFTHADFKRIALLQEVFSRGAHNGLQLIILTCHPQNYRGLTEAEVYL